MSTNDNKCQICDKDFSSSFAYRRHIKLFHGCVSEHLLTRGVSCGHPDCANVGIRFGNMEKYREHLNDVHRIEDILRSVDVIFQTFEGFVQWKLVQEARDKANFIVSRGALKTKDGTKHVYGCNRSGSYRSQRTGKRQPKAQGSRKIGYTCPSAMIVHHVKKSWVVKYYPTHYGHENEIEHLSLSAKDRLEIADQLSKGVPPQRIVSNMQISYSESEEKRHHPTLKDVANVARAFGLDKELEGESATTEPSATCTASEVKVEHKIMDLETANRRAYHLDKNPLKKLLGEIEELSNSADPNDPATVAACRHLMHAKRLLSFRRRKGATLPLPSDDKPGDKLTSPAYWLKAVNKDRLRKQRKISKVNSAAKSDASTSETNSTQFSAAVSNLNAAVSYPTAAAPHSSASAPNLSAAVPNHSALIFNPNASVLNPSAAVLNPSLTSPVISDRYSKQYSTMLNSSLTLLQVSDGQYTHSNSSFN